MKFNSVVGRATDPCTIIFLAIIATATTSDNNDDQNSLNMMKTDELELKSIEYCDNIMCYAITVAIISFIYVIIDCIMLEFNARYDNIMFYIGLYGLSYQLSLFYDYSINARLFTVLNRFVGSYFVCNLLFCCLFISPFFLLFPFVLLCCLPGCEREEKVVLFFTVVCLADSVVTVLFCSVLVY